MSHRFARHAALACLPAILLACGGDGPTGDTSPPRVLSLTPTGGASGIARTSTITVTLSEPADPATVDASTFTVAAIDGTPIAGTRSVQDRNITFAPSVPLAHGTTYVARLTSGIRDLAGNALVDPVAWSFAVEPNPAPVVVSTTPASGATGVDGTKPITVTFSEPITAPAGSFRLFAGRTIAGTTSIDGSTVTFTPESRLAMGALHGVQLTTDIRDLEGMPLAAAFGWTFRTAIDSAPEHVAPRISLGVAVIGERLDAAGDIDDFFINGTAGDEWVVFIRTDPQPQFGTQILLVDSLTGDLVNSTITPAAYPDLDDWSLGRVILPRTGAYRVRITADGPSEYEFRVDRINRAPESGTATFAIGTVISETIGTVADVDEFSFQGTAGEEVNIFLQLVSGMTGGLRLDLVHNGNGIRHLETTTPTASLDDLGTGRLALPATGAYTIRVSGPFRGANMQNTGTYRFEVAPIDRRPENGAVLRFDTPPVNGAIDRPGDVDEYEFTGTAGQLLVMHLAGAGVTGGSLVGHLIGSDGTTRYSVATVNSPFDSIGATYSRRLTLPYTGTYRMRVFGLHEWQPVKGAYSLEAYTVSAAPERVPATVALGEIVSGEAIDRPGDLDVFTFRGEAGRDANLFLGWSETNEELFAHLGVAGMFTFVGSPDLNGRSTGRFPMKDSTYTVTVDAHWSAQDHMMHSAGPYAFRVFPIDRRPEGRPAAYTLGDTISAEVLHPAGDIDEYTFELTETTTLELFWDAPFSGPSDAVTGLLFSVGSYETALLGVVGQAPLVRTVTVPAGRYEMVVLNQNVRVFGDPFMARIPTLEYRFAIGRKASP